MTSPEDAIRARRRLTNRLIAAHHAGRLRPFLDPQVKVIAAFEAQFRDPDFVTYDRTPERIEVDQAGLRAAESGRWVGSWRAGRMAGAYMAIWRKVTGQWVIESEMFVTLEDRPA